MRKITVVMATMMLQALFADLVLGQDLIHYSLNGLRTKISW
jgi:hypothetical protein